MSIDVAVAIVLVVVIVQAIALSFLGVPQILKTELLQTCTTAQMKLWYIILQTKTLATRVIQRHFKQNWIGLLIGD